MVNMQTTFFPQQNGFAFVNSFDLPQLKIPVVRVFQPARFVVGLCGGMCYAALDYYYAQANVPSGGVVTEITPALRKYLYRRQMDSLAPVVMLRLVDWLLQDDEYVKQMTEEVELTRLFSLLNAGLPAVLCLVRTRGLSNPTNNHQVVAVGYETEPQTQEIHISLYDPNHPLLEPYLCVPPRSRPEENISQSTGEPLRGFFVMPYQPSASLPKI